MIRSQQQKAIDNGQKSTTGHGPPTGPFVKKMTTTFPNPQHRGTGYNKLINKTAGTTPTPRLSDEHTKQIQKAMVRQYEQLMHTIFRPRENPPME